MSKTQNRKFIRVTSLNECRELGAMMSRPTRALNLQIFILTYAELTCSRIV